MPLCCAFLCCRCWRKRCSAIRPVFPQGCCCSCQSRGMVLCHLQEYGTIVLTPIRILQLHFTARNSSCGKVMFSQVYVSLSVHRADIWYQVPSKAVGYAWATSPLGEGGMSMRVGMSRGWWVGISQGWVPTPTPATDT